MEKSLLSKKQLAKRWEMSISTLDRRVKEGLISPVKGYKTPKFNMDDVLRAKVQM